MRSTLWLKVWTFTPPSPVYVSKSCGLTSSTFDVSILDVSSGVFEVKSTSVDTFLGSEDFEGVLTQYILDKFKKVNGFGVVKARC